MPSSTIWQRNVSAGRVLTAHVRSAPAARHDAETARWRDVRTSSKGLKIGWRTVAPAVPAPSHRGTIEIPSANVALAVEVHGIPTFTITSVPAWTPIDAGLPVA